MNKLQPYEQLIAREVEQIQVPDNADAIWSVIEKQLDLDLPTDGNQQRPPTSPAPGAGLGKGLLLLALVSVVAGFLFILIKNNSVEQTAPVVPPPAIIRSADSNRLTPSSSKDQPVINPPVRSHSRIKADSSRYEPTLLPLSNDSLGVRPLTGLPGIVADSTNSKPVAPPPIQEKKQKGIKGLSDSDYKIVPVKKD